ncbi:MAG: HDOD domain-containing protein [Oligoflexia bacterium]|nr:HDOD domain-containing protein [Oligoflexia bacterium]
MNEINMRKLYTNVLVPLTPSKSIQKIIEITMTGSADAEHYIDALENNKEITKYILNAANAISKTSTIKDLAHGMALLGVNKIRDTVLGISLIKMFNPASDLPTKFSDAIELVEHAVKAEEQSITLRSNYPEVAYAGGFVFDLIYNKIKNYTVKNLDNKELSEPSYIVNEVWDSGLKTAMVCEKLGSHFKIMHKKYLFVTGLVHNIGKIVLYAYDPIQYDNIVTNMKQNNILYSKAEYEEILFSHSSLGSLFLKLLSFLEIVEKAVDFHHDVHLLKHDDVELYELATILNISTNIVSFLGDGGKPEEFPLEKIVDEMSVINCSEKIIRETLDFASKTKI